VDNIVLGAVGVPKRLIYFPLYEVVFDRIRQWLHSDPAEHA
jgi:hypothetical protein